MIGIQCTDNILAAASSTGNPRDGKIVRQAKTELSEGVIEEGMVRDTEALGDAFGDLCSELGDKKVVLCLPASVVYTVLLEAEDNDDIEEQMAALIPEEIGSLRYKTEKISGEEGGQYVAVTAVRQDVLDGYAEAAQQAGCKIAAVTTLPLAVAGVLEDPVLLITACTDMLATASVVAGKRVIDEAILPEGSGEEAIVDEAEGILSEYEEMWGIEHAVVVGTKSVFKEAQAVLGEEEETEEEDDGEAGLQVEMLYPWIKSKNLRIAGAAVAALGVSAASDISGNGTQRRWWLWGTLIAVLCAAAALLLWLYPERFGLG